MAKQANVMNVDAVSVTTPLAAQTITFNPLTDKMYGDVGFGLTASASSGLPVTFGVFSGPATLTGSTLSITGAGNVTIRASQAGNDAYLPAQSVDRTFTVNPASEKAGLFEINKLKEPLAFRTPAASCSAASTALSCDEAPFLTDCLVEKRGTLPE